MVESLTWAIDKGDIEITAIRDGALIGLSELSSESRIEWSVGLSRLAAAHSNSEPGVSTLPADSGYRLTPNFVASLTSEQARSLGLPPDVPFSLWVRLTGSFVSSTTKAITAWHDTSGSPVRLRQEAGLVFLGSKAYRIPGPLAKIEQACLRFNSSGHDLDARLAATSQLKTAIESMSGQKLGVDRQIDDMRFRHASGVSLDLHVSKDGVQFDPIFFSDEALKSVRQTGDMLAESSALLTPELQRSLAGQFRTAQEVKATYVLAKGEYLYVDSSVREILRCIKDYQGRSPEERARFARSPQSFFKEHLKNDGLSDEDSDVAVESTFFETDAFSERVIQVGLWKPPVLPFIKRAPNSWFPESFGLKIGSKTIAVSEQQLEPLAKAIANGLVENISEVNIPGVSEAVPVSRDSLDAVNALLEIFLKVPPIELPAADSQASAPGGEMSSRDLGSKSILIVQQNFEEDSFSAQFQERKAAIDCGVPGLLSTLKAHQELGLDWLKRCWHQGYPGVLLADDMGLGKTLQLLCFIVWLKAATHKKRPGHHPAIVVAPVSLLGNWESEARRHFSTDAMGKMARLYGHSLGQFRRGGFKRPDVIEGVATLEVDELRSFDLILTTYETMRDYHLSLGVIDFSVIAFDEMQRIKNPQSMMTNAAQALRGDFKVGLTGTPIENSLADIWTIFDTLMPGALGLGNLKSFLSHYSLDNTEALLELRSRLISSSERRPAPMLRRMKSEISFDLPVKKESNVQREMPPNQAVAYIEAVKAAGNEAGYQGRLAAFHRIRGVSLHPIFAGDQSLPGDEYVSQSARLQSCVSVLDSIAQKGEKALLFVESLTMQEWLSFYLKERYSLERYPDRIYGGTSADKRTAIVETFQKAPTHEFAVLILSPKAAGVGLTLTAANHVIHLTRWWNPAVEDQCTDRAYRIGQTKDVNVYYLQAVHPVYGDASFDCVLDRLLAKKRLLSAGMLVPSETGEELKEIFEALSIGQAN